MGLRDSCHCKVFTSNGQATIPGSTLAARENHTSTVHLHCRAAQISLIHTIAPWVAAVARLTCPKSAHRREMSPEQCRCQCQRHRPHLLGRLLPRCPDRVLENHPHTSQHVTVQRDHVQTAALGHSLQPAGPHRRRHPHLRTVGLALRMCCPYRYPHPKAVGVPRV